MRNENEALLFDEASPAAAPTGVQTAAKGPGALLETSETKPQQAGGAARTAAPAAADAISPSTYEIAGWANAIRCGEIGPTFPGQPIFKPREIARQLSWPW